MLQECDMLMLVSCFFKYTLLPEWFPKQNDELHGNIFIIPTKEKAKKMFWEHARMNNLDSV